MKRLMLIFALGCAATLLAEPLARSRSVPSGWSEDFAAAKVTAEKKEKLVLLAFSGSDWCGWCRKLDGEVYSQKSFVNKAKGQFVLTMIDNPRDESILSELAARQNRALTQQFKVNGFPCAVVCRPDGTEVGRIEGYVAGGPKAYLKRLRKIAPPPEKTKPQLKPLKKPSAE